MVWYDMVCREDVGREGWINGRAQEGGRKEEEGGKEGGRKEEEGGRERRNVGRDVGRKSLE